MASIPARVGRGRWIVSVLEVGNLRARDESHEGSDRCAGQARPSHSSNVAPRCHRVHRPRTRRNARSTHRWPASASILLNRVRLSWTCSRRLTRSPTVRAEAPSPIVGIEFSSFRIAGRAVRAPRRTLPHNPAESAAWIMASPPRSHRSLRSWVPFTFVDVCAHFSRSNIWRASCCMG